MPENNVIISIRGQQTYQGADEESVELVTEGLLRPECGGYTLSYQESEVTGMAGTLTTFQIEKDCITLVRAGEVNSQMVFQEGRRHLSMYETPYGQLALGVNTRRMRADLNDKGGDIEIDYNIEIDHRVAGVNTFQISVREKKPGAIPQ
ncbi:MAG: DUF1934 domain-containing protein [Clostridiales bacterium]|nr:DUF1934 domain-containing protein [Clostridiales bacterium]